MNVIACRSALVDGVHPAVCQAGRESGSCGAAASRPREPAHPLGAVVRRRRFHGNIRALARFRFARPRIANPAGSKMLQGLLLAIVVAPSDRRRGRGGAFPARPTQVGGDARSQQSGMGARGALAPSSVVHDASRCCRAGERRPGLERPAGVASSAESGDASDGRSSSKCPALDRSTARRPAPGPA